MSGWPPTRTATPPLRGLDAEAWSVGVDPVARARRARRPAPALPRDQVADRLHRRGSPVEPANIDQSNGYPAPGPPRATGVGIGTGSAGAGTGSHRCSLSNRAAYGCALGSRTQSSSLRRNMRLFQPRTSTARTRRSVQRGTDRRSAGRRGRRRFRARRPRMSQFHSARSPVRSTTSASTAPSGAAAKAIANAARRPSVSATGARRRFGGHTAGRRDRGSVN
jgi:hypothetical protein